MVGQVVGAVAPVVVQSAKENGGLINSLLKVVTIVAIVSALLITGLILFLAFNIWEAVGGTFETIGSIFSFAFPSVNPLVSIFTGILSAFAIRR
jgi:hypothetical protein